MSNMEKDIFHRKIDKSIYNFFTHGLFIFTLFCSILVLSLFIIGLIYNSTFLTLPILIFQILIIWKHGKLYSDDFISYVNDSVKECFNFNILECKLEKFYSAYESYISELEKLKFGLVYFLIDINKKEIFYVGQTINPKNREYAHRRRFRDKEFIFYIQSSELSPEIRTNIERYWIMEFGLDSLENKKLP